MHNKQTPSLNRSRFAVKAPLLAVLAASVMLTAVPAQAMMSNYNRINITVNAEDLKTDAGIAKVYQAMTVKSQNSCKAAGFSDTLPARVTSLRGKYEAKKCRRKLLSSFILDLDNERLSAYHLAMTK